MNDDELIAALRERAEDAATRTDSFGRGCPALPPPASAKTIQEAEVAMGYKLHPLHRRLLEEVANGGFGPGDGLIELSGGCLDAHGRSAPELREALRFSADEPLPVGVVPLFDLGDGAWLCTDESDPNASVLVLDEFGLTDVGAGLREILVDWVRGVDAMARLFETIATPGIDPFTRTPMTYTSRGRARGVPYLRR